MQGTVTYSTPRTPPPGAAPPPLGLARGTPLAASGPDISSSLGTITTRVGAGPQAGSGADQVG